MLAPSYQADVLSMYTAFHHLSHYLADYFHKVIWAH